METTVMVLGFRGSCLGFRAWVFGLGSWGLGFRAGGLGLRVKVLRFGFGVRGSRFRVRVWASG